MFYEILQALTEVKNLCQDSERIKDSIILSFLENSKGLSKLDSSLVVYRPYIVASRLLSVYPPREGIIKASGTDGVEWLNPKETIQNLKNLQADLDAEITSIPKTWLAVEESEEPLHILGAFLA